MEMEHFEAGRHGEPGILESGILESGILESGILESGILEPGILETGVLDSRVSHHIHTTIKRVSDTVDIGFKIAVYSPEVDGRGLAPVDFSD